MDAILLEFTCFIIALIKLTSAVPPSICLEEFKWQDCGKPPKAVLYHYKSGSRCEVGIWRGCLPNPNMFANEYDCVQTCIFGTRARPFNFHSFSQGQDEMFGDEVYPDKNDGNDDAATLPDGDMTDNPTTFIAPEVNDNAASDNPSPDNAVSENPSPDDAAPENPPADDAAPENPPEDDAAPENPPADDAAPENPPEEEAAPEDGEGS